MIPRVDHDTNHFSNLSALLSSGLPVFVYKNLHKDCFSVKQKNRVVCHTSYICLKDCKFVVQPKGRERVLREKRKNVHAWVKGYLCDPKETNGFLPFSWDCVRYDPYKYPSFVISNSATEQIPITYSRFCDMFHGEDLLAYSGK